MPPESNDSSPITAPPSPRQQSWGAIISIIVIVLMVIIGAFYAWGKRVSQYSVPATSSLTP